MHWPFRSRSSSSQGPQGNHPVVHAGGDGVGVSGDVPSLSSVFDVPQVVAGSGEGPTFGP